MKNREKNKNNILSEIINSHESSTEKHVNSATPPASIETNNANVTAITQTEYELIPKTEPFIVTFLSKENGYIFSNNAKTKPTV